MQGRLGALALIVGITALPLQASPAFADTCEMVGNNGSMLINDGSGRARSWRINIDGVTYQSDQFDKLTKETRKRIVKEGNKKFTYRDVVFTFKDTASVTRTPIDDVVKTVDAVIKGEINESNDTGFVVIKDKSNNRDYRINDPEHGLPVNCG
jgi:hypothetical protein